MAKDKLVEYDSVANNNTVVGDVNLQESSMLPSDVNNAIREVMSHQKEAFGSGTPLYVDQTNNRVGIGTTSSPSADLHILGSSGLRIVNSDDTTNLALLNFDNNESPALSLYSNDTTTVRIHSEGTSFFNGGNLLVGTTTSFNALNGRGDIVAGNGSSNGGMTIYTGSSNQGAITFADGTSGDQAYRGKVEYNHSNDSMIFNIGATERFRVHSGGNFSIASTSTGGGSILTLSTGSFTHGIKQFCNNGQKSLLVEVGGSEVGSISHSSSSTAYNTSSDHRLKENVTADWDATTRLKQLNPVRFNFISDADTTVDGFLAHEVQSVVPEAITGTHNEVDADGNPVYQGIDQSKLVPLLVKTIQELEARITALENGE